MGFYLNKKFKFKLKIIFQMEFVDISEDNSEMEKIAEQNIPGKVCDQFGGKLEKQGVIINQDKEIVFHVKNEQNVERMLVIKKSGLTVKKLVEEIIENYDLGSCYDVTIFWKFSYDGEDFKTLVSTKKDLDKYLLYKYKNSKMGSVLPIFVETKRDIKENQPKDSLLERKFVKEVKKGQNATKNKKIEKLRVDKITKDRLGTMFIIVMGEVYSIPKKEE